MLKIYLVIVNVFMFLDFGRLQQNLKDESFHIAMNLNSWK